MSERRPRDRMQADLSAAIRARDVVRVKALRTALAALSNAEAVDAASVPSLSQTASTETQRRHLRDTDIAVILVDEIGELRRAADELRELGQVPAAAGLEAQAAAIASYVD